MRTVSVQFSCGHMHQVAADGASPACQTCGNRSIAYVQAPAPTIRGVATGPHVETVQLEACAVSLKKESDDGERNRVSTGSE